MPFRDMEAGMKCRRIVVVAVLAAVTLGACSSDNKTGSSPSGPNGGGGTVTVYTSGVLKDIIDRLVSAYTKYHKAAKITIVTKASPKQLKATVTASRPSILILVNRAARELGANLKPFPLGQSRAVIAVSDTNPKKVKDVTAFALTSGLKTALCGTRTGFGNTTQWVLWRSRITADPKTVGAKCEESAMLRVAKGELDAVLLFRPGSHPPKGVKLIEIPAKQNAIFDISYLVVGKTASVTRLGAFLATPGAHKILKTNGYLT
jgi:ABC-type molybdate transport system substrate-binding protein